MDIVIIASFVQMTEEEARGFEGTRVFVDERNRRRA
jgi:aspartate 1-decarboxylase